MTIGGPVARVTALLVEAGYEVIEQPEVAGIPFEFEVTLAADASLDLVVVVDLAVQRDEDRLRRAIEAFARALDLVRSRRSLTVVLVGPPPHRGLTHAVALVARVLRVPPDRDDGEQLRDALSVLLPLETGGVAAEDAVDIGWGETCQRLLNANEGEVAPVLKAAARGEDAVRRAAGSVLSVPIDELTRGDGDGS